MTYLRVLQEAQPFHFLLFIGIALILISCEDNSQAYLGTPIHSCEIVSPQEIAVILGFSVDDPQERHTVNEQAGYWVSMCNWSASEAGISVGVMIKPNPSSKEFSQAAYEAFAEDIRKVIPDYEMRPVEGLGAKAAWNGEMAQLMIFDNSYSYIVSVLNRDGDDSEKLDLAKKISTAILSKLNH